MNRYRLDFSYVGDAFQGFQKQAHFKTIEDCLMRSIKRVFKDVDSLIGSGRTDSGVHAENQVCHFDSCITIPDTKIHTILNHSLPQDIFVFKATKVSQDFQARKKAKLREYQYLFTPDIVPLYYKSRVLEIKVTPQQKDIQKIEDIILGEHDFKVFRKSGSDEKTTVRTIESFELRTKHIESLYLSHQKFKLYIFRIRANAFLYRMVRNIVGLVFEVLKGEVTIEEFNNYFYDRTVKVNFKPAPAKGLSLVKVYY